MKSYEFTAEQNQVIGSLAGRMRWVSIMFVLIGIGLFVSLIPNIQAEVQWVIVVASGLFALINLVKGIVFYRPIDNLSNIVHCVLMLSQSHGPTDDDLFIGCDHFSSFFDLMKL